MFSDTHIHISYDDTKQNIIVSELKILATKRFEARIDAHHKYIANSRLISKPGVHQLNEAFESIGENCS